MSCLLVCFPTVTVAFVAGHPLLSSVTGQVLCNCVSTCFGHVCIVHWSSLHIAPVISLSVQIILIAGCRFGDTVHPPVKIEIFSFPENFLICVDTLIVKLLSGQWPYLLPRSRSSGVLLHSGHSQICLTGQVIVFAHKVNGIPFAFVLATVMTLLQLHGHLASLLRTTTHILPVLSLSKRAVISLVIGHLGHSFFVYSGGDQIVEGRLGQGGVQGKPHAYSHVNACAFSASHCDVWT